MRTSKTTPDQDIKYLGSGKFVRACISSHGLNSHVKSILQEFPTRELLANAEKALITQQVLDDPLSMNLHLGGYGGGWTSEQQIANAFASAKAQAELRRTTPEWSESRNKAISQSNKKAYQEGRRTLSGCFSDDGRKISIAKSAEMSYKRKQRYSDRGFGYNIGSANSSFGSKWMTKDGLSKRVSADQVKAFLDQGYSFGRKM